MDHLQKAQDWLERAKPNTPTEMLLAALVHVELHRARLSTSKVVKT